MNLSNVALAAQTEGLSLAEKGIISAKVVLTGFVVVFVMLILLILIIKIYSAIVQKAQGLGGNGKSGKNSKEKKAEKKSDKTNSASLAVAKNGTAGISDEVIAVISAAVATLYGSSKAKIKSIKKSSERSRSAWAKAGVLDNTRPF